MHNGDTVLLLSPAVRAGHQPVMFSSTSKKTRDLKKRVDPALYSSVDTLFLENDCYIKEKDMKVIIFR